MKNTCTPVFTAVLFTIAKIWKQPKCPSIDEWINTNMGHLHNGILPDHKKKILPFAAVWMDLENILLSETSQSKKNKYHIISLMWNLMNKLN